MVIRQHEVEHHGVVSHGAPHLQPLPGRGGEVDCEAIGAQAGGHGFRQPGIVLDDQQFQLRVQEYSNFTPKYGSGSSMPSSVLTPRRSSHSSELVFLRPYTLTKSRKAITL